MPPKRDDTMLEWIERARRGDGEAFGRLVEKYRKPLKGFILGKMHVDEGSAEDLAQDIWLSVFEDLSKSPEEGGYDPKKGAFYTYVIHRFAKFRILQWREERSKNREIQDVPGKSESPGMHDRIAGGASGPLQRMLREEALRRRLEAHAELFRLLFLCGGYPHQQLAFGLSKLLYGRQSDRGVEGAPERVDREHGSICLEELARTFWEAYCSQTRIDDPGMLQKLRQHLEPLLLRLPLKVGELLENDGASMKRFENLLSAKAARTCFDDYYGARRGGFTAAIPDWCYKVEKRIRLVLDAGADACKRCKLRHLPPCLKSRIDREKS